MGTTSTGDWPLWWGTFRDLVDARLQVWRCSEAGLNLGEPILVMTVADAHHRRLDDEAIFRAYLASRFGVGRYRITPRSDQGAKLPGTHSLVTAIAEDSTMPSPTPTTSPLIPPPMDHDTAIEIERMRLAAEMERERDARRERHREQREERRRERDQDRERRRQEDRARRDDEDRRRSDRDAQTQTMLMQVLKEIAAGRSATSADPLVAAALAKIGQPDPLVLKLLDTHGKREELTDFFKVQAESMRMASALQTDSLRQVMAASQDVQAQLIRQATEVASHQAGMTGWDGLGSVLGATAQVIGALRAPTGTETQPVMEARLITHANPSTSPTLPVYQRTVVSSVVAGLRKLRALQQGCGEVSNEDLQQTIALLPLEITSPIARGDLMTLQNALMPAFAHDPSLGRWVQQPMVTDWLTGIVGRLQRLLSRTPAIPQPNPTSAGSCLSSRDDDVIL
jgi:hypothetical protein